MVLEKSSYDRPSTEDEQIHEKLSDKTRQAAEEVRGLIRSISMGAEERITIEDHINNISREAEYMLDRIDSIKRINQQKVLLAYKKYLENNLEAINQRLNGSQ
jgi:hypothetical protein